VLFSMVCFVWLVSVSQVIHQSIFECFMRFFHGFEKFLKITLKKHIGALGLTLFCVCRAYGGGSESHVSIHSSAARAGCC
jgi:hypothetical protein